MPFFDDLKKPEETLKPQKKQFVITNREREQLTNELWSKIQSGCTLAKSNGKRFYKSNYACFLGDGVYYGRDGITDRHYRRVGVVCDNGSYDSKGNWILNTGEPYIPGDERVVNYDEVYWDATERDKILQLLRKKLAEEGFPANAATADEYYYGGEGSGFIRRNQKMMHTIKMDVRW